jgi:hypothetical protein
MMLRRIGWMSAAAGAMIIAFVAPGSAFASEDTGFSADSEQHETFTNHDRSEHHTNHDRSEHFRNHDRSEHFRPHRHHESFTPSHRYAHSHFSPSHRYAGASFSPGSERADISLEDLVDAHTLHAWQHGDDDAGE